MGGQIFLLRVLSQLHTLPDTVGKPQLRQNVAYPPALKAVAHISPTKPNPPKFG